MIDENQRAAAAPDARSSPPVSGAPVSARVVPGEEGAPGEDGSAPPVEVRSDPACALCGAAVPPAAARRVNEHLVCPACAAQVLAELAATEADLRSLPLAGLAGLAGAVVGAAAWAALTAATGLEIGYAAVGVGLLAGLGVKLGARRRRGGWLPHLAVGIALLGLLLAKYFVFVYLLADATRGQPGTGVLPLLIASLVLFPSMLVRMVSPFDLLWVLFAVSAAWRMPAASRVRFGR